jgi:DNA ligase (NAD+)
MRTVLWEDAMVKEKHRLAGKRVVIAGTLKTMTYYEAAVAIRNAGGELRTQVSPKVDYVVLGSDPSHRKVHRAHWLGAKFVTEEWLRDRLNEA